MSGQRQGNSAVSCGRGFRKVILINEHFVVYGVPAIVGAIDYPLRVQVRLREGEGMSFLIEEEGHTTPLHSDRDHREAVKRILDELGVSAQWTRMEFTISGGLTTWTGLGSSAAFCVGTARALSELSGTDLSDERTNEIAYEGEKIFAGTPSGIDNTVATFGGLLWFEKGSPPTVECLQVHIPIEIVIGNTGVISLTREQVSKVRMRRQEEPERFRGLFDRARENVEHARQALRQGDLPRLGILMNENQDLLREIGVSCKELDLLVQTALNAGAMGAKLTGKGAGGCMIALTGEPGRSLRVAEAIRAQGYPAVCTRVVASSWCPG